MARRAAIFAVSRVAGPNSDISKPSQPSMAIPPAVLKAKCGSKRLAPSNLTVHRLLMNDYLPTVKITRSYHHRDLRATLLEAAEGLLAEKGVEGFSLRETARRAGVSPVTPKHHSSDVRALLPTMPTSTYNE